MLRHVRSLRYWSILIAQVVLLFISAVMRNHPWIRVIFALMMVVVFGTVISAIWRDSKMPRAVATVAAIVAVLTGAVGHLLTGTLLSMHFCRQAGMPIDWMMVASMVSYALFVAMAIYSIARHIFLHDHITGNVIAGGICVYMLIGMFYAFVYAAIALVVPDVFNMAGEGPLQIYLTDYFFFSYSTLTTVGFGDMTVRDYITRIVATLEAVSGSLFIAIMIAGLVGTYFSQRKSSQHAR